MVILKPRGFWDYALFALVMASALMLLFWLQASNAVGWTDAAIAFAAAVLLVFFIILSRWGEKAKWIEQPSWHVSALITLGVFVFLFGAIYADSYLLHPGDLTSETLGDDIVFFLILFVLNLSFPSRSRAKRQVL